ncbi:MAG: nuclear transport factor 2 family protein [Gammaproteobacteria bacterium]|nr:nuclear transport factor 2 family protein [Gammaproteobacteria bacterium]
MTFVELITQLTQSAAQGNGKAVADCFTADGIYHDCFYGSFQGADDITEMIEHYFHRDGENFIWDLHDPVSDGELGYVRYVFSYDSKLEDSKGKRSLFEGVCICRMKDGLLSEYREIANAGTGLQLIGFSPERLAKFLAREAKELLARPESAHHIQ